MTDRPAPRQLPRRPGPWPVIAGSLALFLVMLAFLVVQLRTGRDPALGAGASPTKRVLVRRLEDRVVVTRVVQDDGQAEGHDGGSAGTVVAGSVPAPASAPAPASPPVSTGSS